MSYSTLYGHPGGVSWQARLLNRLFRHFVKHPARSKGLAAMNRNAKPDADAAPVPARARRTAVRAKASASPKSTHKRSSE